MIYRLTGSVSAIEKDAFVLKTDSIEWYIEASTYTLGRLSRSQGQVSILTYLLHREDQMTLYGFYDAREKEVFNALISVQGIGPKAALKILSGIDPESFVAALELEDIARLEAVPGLGKKTAQKILLALTGKLSLRQEQDASGARSEQSLLPDLEEALIQMGYDRRQVRESLPLELLKLWEKSPFAPEMERGSRDSRAIAEALSKLPKPEREKLEAELLRACILALS